MLKASLMGGMLGGLISSVPIISKANACCCALVVLGGVFAAWVLESDTKGTAGSGRCAGAGWIAGAIAGFVSVPLGGLLNRIVFGVAELERQLQEGARLLEGLNSGLPPESLEVSESIQRAVVGIDFNAWTFVGALVMAAVFSFFGLLGGLLGHSMFRIRAPRMLRTPPPVVRPPILPPPLQAGAGITDELDDEGEVPMSELPELPRPTAPGEGTSDPDGAGTPPEPPVHPPTEPSRPQD